VTPITTPLKSNRINDIVQVWYANYISDIIVDQTLLFELVTAANFMDIKSLLDLSCLAVSILIQGKTADEIRCIFNISNELHHTNNNNSNNSNTNSNTTASSSTTSMTTTSATAVDPPLGAEE
jgi:S-phase kinase-associated protein 1